MFIEPSTKQRREEGHPKVFITNDVLERQIDEKEA